MPSVQKILYFLSSAILIMIGVAVLGYGMSAEWASATMACGSSESSSYAGSATIQMGLFKCNEIKEFCPFFSGTEEVQVFQRLGKRGGAAVALQALVVVLLVLALVASAGSITVTLYNSVSNPYETYMGPIGLYICSGLSACSAILAMVLYLINILGIKLAKEIMLGAFDVKLKDQTVEFLVGFYMLLPFIVVNMLAILLVYIYAHAAYTQRREQQKPTEDAPKEIMMY
ncbi:clarin-3 [Trichomycterus rosablanca]|uniref:clarin-3 n=1 Tax=Trichomycterus rosablanca TaxID=2290929 RepID=UPI002F35EFBC